MSRTRRWALTAVALLLLLALGPVPVTAQSASGVGVVTTLSGQATVARAAVPQPLPLRFRDDVFEKDRISTAEKSIVRVLLGGKALVTVRELSVLTVTEELGRSTVNLASGKIAVGVARQRMRPGEILEIRTPNAVAAVRGTVLVVEIIQASASSHGGPTPPTTNIHVLHGLVDVYPANNPGAPPVSVGSMQTLSRIGNAPGQLRSLTPEAAERLLADLRSDPQFSQGPDEFQDVLNAQEQSRALTLALAIAPLAGGEGDGGGGGTGANGGASNRPAGDDIRDACSLGSCASGGGSGSAGPGKSGRAVTTYFNQVINVPGDFYSVPNTGNIALGQPLLETTASTLTVGGSLIDVKGTLAANDATSPFVYLDPTVTTLKSFLSLSGGGIFTAASTIIKDLGSPALSVTGDGLTVTGNSSLTTTGAGAAIALDGSAMTVTGNVLAANGALSTVTLKGGLLDQTNGAVVTAQRLVGGVNGALLDASAPLLNLIGNSAFTSLLDAVDLANVNPATQFPTLAKLDSSVFTVTTGAALNLSSTSVVSVGADLFTLANKSTLIILNGVLLSLSGNSSLTVTGALLNFVGTGNKLLVTNSLCGGPCPLIAGIPVLITGGAAVSITNPIKNAAGNTVTFSSPSAALISVSGPGTTLTVKGN